MNKLFGKLRKNRGLSMFVALAMLLTLLPFNTLLAEATVSSGDANYGIATVSDNGAEDSSAPTVTGITSVDGVTDVTAEYPGAVAAVRFTPAGGASNSFCVGVQNHDVSKYTKAQIEITPYRASMPFAIYNNGGCYSGWWFKALGAAEKQTVEVDLTAGDAAALTNVTEFQFFLDNAPLDTTAEVDVVIHSIKLIDPNAPVEEPSDVVEVPVTLAVESGNFVIDSEGRLFTETAQKLRGALDFPETFRVEAGKVLTINYDTNIASLPAEFTYGNGSADVFFNKTFTSGTNSMVIEIDDAWVAYFAGNTDYAAAPTRARLKLTEAPAGSYFAITSVTYGSPEGSGEDPVAPAAPSWTSIGGPTVTIDMASEGYTCVANEDGSVDVTYTPGSWGKLLFNVTEFDVSTCSQLKIDITPSWSGMNLGVLDAEGNYYLNHWGPNIVAEETRHTITANLTASTAGFVFYCDPGTCSTLPEGAQTFTIHSVKVVDPTMPDADLVDAVLSVESGDFSITTPGTMEAPNGGKLRARITFPMDFRVEEGKQLTFYYDTNIDGMTVDPTWDWTDSNVADTTFKAEEKSTAFIMDQTWVDYFNNNATGTNPTVRLKLDTTPAGSNFTLKYVTYGDVVGTQYDPAQVPKGLVVTYYNDIYSRGVAWNTNDTVTDNALYVVKATDGMTAETVDWTAAEVVKVDATYKATVDYAQETWHTFKAHVENLEKEATYFYRAGHEETGWSKVGSFTIAGDAEKINDTLSFIHVTDSQEESQAGFQKWARVLKDAYGRMPEASFVAHTGDFVNRSESKGIHMEEWVYCFDEPMTQIMNGIVVPSMGNHECYDYAFTDRFDIDWADYKKDSDADLKYGGCYTLTYGDDIVLINLSNTYEAWNYDTDFKLYQLPWLIEQLEKYKDYKWKIVQLHEGLMSGGDHTNDGEVDTMRDTLPPIFAKYKVDLVLQGHDHVYTRTRSYYYGENIFEEAETPVYFDGHSPVWLETKEETRTVNGEERTVYLEPQGTHYVTINTCGSKTYPEEPATTLDPVIFEGDNPINPLDENGNGGCLVQPGLPMYGLVRIEGDLLIYDSYTYDHGTRTSELYDSFAVDKTYTAGYNADDPHEGKDEVTLYGIKIDSKKFDGKPVKLDITGFNCSEPSIMDYTALKYTITGTLADGTPFNPKDDYVGVVYGKLPTKPGTYQLTVSVPQDNRYFWGEKTFNFTISE